MWKAVVVVRRALLFIWLLLHRRARGHAFAALDATGVLDDVSHRGQRSHDVGVFRPVQGACVIDGGINRAAESIAVQCDWALSRISRMGTVDIRRSTLTSPETVRLIAALNAELKATFPEPGATHFSLTGGQVEAGDGAFLIAYITTWRLVAARCAGWMGRPPNSSGCASTLRPRPRNGRALVEALEREARLLGVTKMVLETGTRLAPAIKLYKAKQ